MRLFQVQETASAKALRQEWSWPSEMRQEGRWAREEWTAECARRQGQLTWDLGHGQDFMRCNSREAQEQRRDRTLLAFNLQSLRGQTRAQGAQRGDGCSTRGEK